MFRIGEEGSKSQQGFQSMDSLVVALLDRVTELHENGAEDVTGVRTGYFDLDRMTSGFQPGDLVVLAARPSMGKTAFALNIAEHVAVSEGLPVVVFSMEMGAAQLALRLVVNAGQDPPLCDGEDADSRFHAGASPVHCESSNRSMRRESAWPPCRAARQMPAKSIL